MSAYLLALLLQPAPPAPPIVSVPPPILVPSVRTVPDYRSEPPTPIRVRVTAGNVLLFNDRLSVDGMQGASFSQNRSEAPATACPGPDRYDRQQSTYFTLRLNKRMGSSDERMLSVSVTWTRPIDGDPCLGSGTRGATLNQVIPLVPGKTAVVTGDGGLRVEITPR